LTKEAKTFVVSAIFVDDITDKVVEFYDRSKVVYHFLGDDAIHTLLKSKEHLRRCSVSWVKLIISGKNIDSICGVYDLGQTLAICR
jgi:hypothetical protein